MGRTWLSPWANRAWGGHPQLSWEPGSTFGREWFWNHLAGYLRMRGPMAYKCIAEYEGSWWADPTQGGCKDRGGPIRGHQQCPLPHATLTTPSSAAVLPQWCPMTPTLLPDLHKPQTLTPEEPREPSAGIFHFSIIRRRDGSMEWPMLHSSVREGEKMRSVLEILHSSVNRKMQISPKGLSLVKRLPFQ